MNYRTIFIFLGFLMRTGTLLKKESTIKPLWYKKSKFVNDMKKPSKSILSPLAKRGKAARVSPRLNNIEDAAFFKKKMAKGRKMLAKAGVPKP
jgi:hypothetical protein